MLVDRPGSPWRNAPGDLARLLREDAQDPGRLPDLRNWAADRGIALWRPGADLFSELARAVHDGRIGLAGRAQPGATAPTGGGSTDVAEAEAPARRPDRRPRAPAPRAPAPPPPPPAPAENAQKTWIEFRVVDDATNKPVSGVQMRIKLTDGAVAVHTTDSAGVIRIDGIDPGTCGIEEIDADPGAEVAKVS